MTDEELIAHLRDSKGWQNLGNAAADRIEALLEGGKGLAEAFAIVAVKREMAEAKLAKAVDALQYYAFEDVYGIGPARAVLTELEKTE